MDILVVSNMYPSEKDPVYGTFVKNFVEDVRRRNPGGRVDVCTICGRRMGTVAKVKAYAGYYLRLLRALASSKHDLIYVHTITFPIIPIRIVRLFRRLPLVLNVHGDDVLPSNRLKRFLRGLAVPVVNSAKLVVCPSEYFKGVLKEVFPRLSPDNVFVSPSGGLKPFFYRPKAYSDSPDGCLTLGFISRIDAGKGWDMFVEAVERLNAAGIRCRGVMAGRGAQTPQLERMIAERNLGDSIRYIGPQAQDALPALYGSFDLFVFPSYLNESLGLVGVEAMAAGTPVVASRMAGPQGYVEDGVDGYLFEPRSVDALVDAVKRYAALSPAERCEMSRKAFAKAQGYESEKVGRELYEKISGLATQYSA